MKTNFWKSAATFIVGMAAMVACQKEETPEDVTPVFPSEVIEENVDAGETVEITFEANLEWKLSVPSSEQERFWLLEDGMPVSNIKSEKTGKQTVSVVFSEDEYHNENYIGEVTLTMGGQSKVIARFTRLAVDRALQVYVAEAEEWGFKNTYSSEKATALELTAFEGQATFTLPIKVVANFDWNLSLPSWCEGSIDGAESLSGKTGKAVEIELTGILSEEVKNGAEGFAKFIDATDDTQNMQLPLTLPAFAERVAYLNKLDLTFEADGSSSKIFNIAALDGLVFKALEFDGQYHAIDWADWVTYEDLTEDESSESFFKEYVWKIYANANENSSRVADLFAFPASVFEKIPVDDLSVLCEGDLCPIKKEYEQYHIGRITQKGVAPAFIALYNNLEDPDDQYNSYKATLEPAENTSWWHDPNEGIHTSIEKLGANNKYTLTYSDPNAVAAFTFTGAYEYYKIYDYTPAEVSEDDQEDFWMSYLYLSTFNVGRISMDPTSFVAPDLDEDGTPDPGVTPEAYIVFFDKNGDALAAVQCKYDKNAGGASEGALFNVVSGTAEFGDLASMGIPAGTLNSMISGFGVEAQEEMAILASTKEVEFTTNFNVSSIFIIDMEGNMCQNNNAFSVYLSSSTSFKVTAANESNYLLVFMASDDSVPVVVNYSCYIQGGDAPEGGGAATINPAEFLTVMSGIIIKL